MYQTFSDFGISYAVTAALLDMGFEEPTPIQKLAIPPALEGKDIMGQAQTGTGKTAAFGIPIIERGPRDKGAGPYAIILAPTRELAVQVAQELNRIGAHKRVYTLPIYGGASYDRQIKGLQKGVDIVVGTPGRVIDLINRGSLKLKDIRVAVLDEADEMLNMGFIEDIDTILSHVPAERQIMLFSATLPPEILRISKRYMSKPTQVRVETADMVVSKIKQVLYEVREEDKMKALTRLLDVEDPSLTLIFCHTKRDVDDVSSQLSQMGYSAGAIHGDFKQAHRDEMMRRFKGGEVEILVATDVAARGLDIPDVSHVINYSIPQDPEAYVHRVGRTGRAGKSGIAITLITPRENRLVRMIEHSAKTKIKKEKLPTKDEVLKARERDIVSSVEELIEEGDNAAYMPLVQELFEKHPPEQVVAAALRAVFGEIAVEDIGETRGEFTGRDKGYVRLFITIGKMDKIKVGDIVKSITEESGIPARKIGKIALYDKFSFVEVPAELADRVISAVNNSVVQGRKVAVRHAKDKK